MAGTTKNALRGALRFVDETLKEKDIPQAMRDSLKKAREMLKQSWADMAASKNKPATEAAGADAVDACAQACRACIDACDECLERCQTCPNAGAGYYAMSYDSSDYAHQRCITACKNCITCCAICLRDCETGDLAELEDDCVACADACDRCSDACELCAGACEVCNGDCTACTTCCDTCEGCCDAIAMVSEPAGADSMEMNATEAALAKYVDESGETKTEDGKSFPKSDFAYTPDDTPSHWKLRLTATPGGEPDSGIVGAAAAAFSPGGHRGKQVDIPAADKAAVKAKVRAAWKKANPDKDASDMPDSIKEAVTTIDLTSDVILLTEAGNGSTIPIKIIQPGWGSSGYYSKEVLQRDGPKVFPAGMHMYMDHPTAQEEAARPERSLKDLAAVTMKDAEWMDTGPAGPGLYTEAKPFSDSAQRIKEMAPHIGVSIRASGQAENGEVDGRKGPVIKAITNGKSVDFVTAAGAGGKVLAESARNNAAANVSAEESVEAKELQERLQKAEAENARLREINVLREAREFVTSALPATLPALTRNRLIEALAKNPPVKDGKIDTEAYKVTIAESARQEMAYLASVTGSGRITGMGAGGTSDPTPAQIETQLAESFQAMGYSESTAKLAAKGRA